MDPSSRTSGGAILGDRIRMQQHHADPGIFIRSMATRGTMGGLARATADLARLMDAAGRDYVIIETVGVGQDEIEITSVAQVTVVVLVPGMGDDVQAIKAGIMEIADIFVINKSDHPGADRVELELHAEGFDCPIVRTVATEGKGIPELVAAIDSIGTARTRLAGESACPTAPTIDHLGIAVQSLEQSIAFYESLGLAVAHRETVLTEKVDVAMLPAGDSRIELLQPTAPDSPIAKFLEKRGPGLHHVALRVPDLNAAVSRLKASGARLLNEPRSRRGRPHLRLRPSRLHRRRAVGIDSGEHKLKAEIGVIGGSGLYHMPGFEAQEEANITTPFGNPSDNYVLGTLAGRKVAFLARHGRGHRLSPSELNFRANIYGMKSLGVERIISLSAVGSLKEEHRPQDFVLPDQFFDRTRGRVSTFFGEGLVAHISFSDPICPRDERRAGGRLPRGRRQCEAGRDVSLHGRSGVLHQGRIQRLPQLGHGRHRHDQPAGGQAGARSRDLLRDRRHGDGLRLLASRP